MKYLPMLTAILCFLGGNHAALADEGDDNLSFHGVLVADPCVIPPGEESITLDFGSIMARTLYQNQRTKGQVFTIHLTKCDTAIAKSVSVSFSGTESATLPGLLALDAGSKATGIAIGMETSEGVAQPLNKTGQVTTLINGDNKIKLNAYVQAEPKAIADRTIEAGAFKATATFKLIYD